MAGGMAWSQTPPTGRYALILSDNPVLAQTGAARQSAATAQAVARNRVESAQALVRNELARGIFASPGLATDVLNAVFVAAPASRVAELQTIPGVIAVVPLRRQKDATERRHEAAEFHRGLDHRGRS